jgi:hypothetical protein
MNMEKLVELQLGGETEVLGENLPEHQNSIYPWWRWDRIPPP